MIGVEAEAEAVDEIAFPHPRVALIYFPRLSDGKYHKIFKLSIQRRLRTRL